METTKKEQNIWFGVNTEGNTLEYEVNSEDPYPHVLGKFDVQLHKFNEISGDKGIQSLELAGEEKVAVILPYIPNPRLKPEESQLTSLEKILDRLIHGLALKGTQAIVIGNEDKPDYSQAAPQLGFSQLPSGLWYVKPSLEVNVELKEYMPRPDLKSIVGMYFMNILLKQSWNSREREFGTQRINIVSVGMMAEWCKKALHGQGFSNKSLVADVEYAGNLDFGTWDSKTKDFLINSTPKTAIEYFMKLTELIKQQGHAQGIRIEVNVGYSGEHWCYQSWNAITSLGYKQIDPAMLPFHGMFFKNLNTNKR